MKRKKFIIVSYLLGLFYLTGCSGIKVVSDIDPSVDFSEFKTFEFLGWADNSDQKMNRLDRERIELAFKKEAVKRGLHSAPLADGDLLVTLNVYGKTRTQQTANTTTTAMGRGTGMNRGMHRGMHPGMGRAGMGSPGWGWGTAHSTTVINETQYLDGTLIIEVYDKDDELLIWQAIGTKTVNEDPEKRAKDIQKKVTAIMKKYPVEPK